MMSNRAILLSTAVIATLAGAVIISITQDIRKLKYEKALAKVEVPAPETKIVEYEGGVYYFPFVGGEYRRTITKFCASHTNLEFVSAEGEVTRMNNSGIGTYSDYGVTTGYTVHFRSK